MRLSRPVGSASEAPPKAAPFRYRLVVMVKTPRAGAVKTRLARDIGAAWSTAFYRHTTSAIVSRLANSKAWQTVLAVTPDRDASHPFWPRGCKRLPQGRGDLGQRMQRAFSRLPAGPVVLIGSDIPAVRPHHIMAAFKALGRADAVFGPASDGGYWLVGLRRRPRLLKPFNDVRWSSAHALADTRDNLDGRRVEQVATLRDIDTAADLDAARSWSGRRVLPWSVGQSAYPQTRE